MMPSAYAVQRANGGEPLLCLRGRLRVFFTCVLARVFVSGPACPVPIMINRQAWAINFAAGLECAAARCWRAQTTGDVVAYMCRYLPAAGCYTLTGNDGYYCEIGLSGVSLRVLFVFVYLCVIFFWVGVSFRVVVWSSIFVLLPLVQYTMVSHLVRSFFSEDWLSLCAKSCYNKFNSI